MPIAIPYPTSNGILADGTQMEANLVALLNAVNTALLANGTVSLTGNLSAGNNKITSLALATQPGDAVSVAYLTAAGYAALASSPTFAGALTAASLATTGTLAAGATTLTTLAATAITATSLAASGIVTSLGRETGYRDIPQNPQSAAYTFALTDRGSYVYYTGAAAAVTIPPNATVNFPYGNPSTALLVVNDGSGAVTLTQGAGVTIVLAGTGATGSRSLGVGGEASLVQVSINRWFVSGPGVS